MNTLLLDIDLWDLCKDANGNIAMATPPYSIAQDVASAIKTFLAEVWYNDTLGIPYLTQILGQRPPVTLFQQYMTDTTETVPGVVAGSAVCVLSSFEDRTVTGQVTFRDSVTGKTQTVEFTP